MLEIERLHVPCDFIDQISKTLPDQSLRNKNPMEKQGGYGLF
jgi:hypothetical protein